jgi:hypothetical protein
MRFTGLKQFVGSLALGAVLVTGFSSIAEAQVWGQRDRWEQRREREEERRRREEWRRQREAERYGRYDDYDDDNGRYGGYDNGRYGDYRNNSAYRRELEKGFRDGLDRGEKDAKTRRVPTPENSSHYRKGSQAYREGFARGYERSYRQYANYGRRW